MKSKMILMGVIGAVLLIGGICMALTSRETAQIGGLVMMLCALPAIMEVRFLKIERRLRTLEGKPTD
jgi:hypothetical protein